MAVRDTCVAPLRQDGSKKPRGYTFAGSTDCLADWMRNYTRVTVPSFDLVRDLPSASKPKNAKQQQQQPTITATDQHVAMWTPNGRQLLTPDTYVECVQALESKHVVPLFDMSPPGAARKRQAAAVDRCRRWNQALVTSLATPPSTSHTTDSWLSFVVSDMQLEDDWNPDEMCESQLEFLQDDHQKPLAHGCALIGWNHLPSSQSRVTLPRWLKDHVPSARMMVLATDSLDQVLDAFVAGCPVIGSDLPTAWARDKRAFLIDLDSWSTTPSTEENSKRLRMEGFSTPLLDDNGCFDLNPPSAAGVESSAWFRDRGPLRQGCTCLTCQSHSRAYLYHLVCAKELLAEILLFVHNLHTMLELIKAMNQAVVNGGQSQLCQHIREQCANHGSSTEK